MWFTDPKGDVNGEFGMPICMGQNGCAASVLEATWHCLNNVAAAQFEEDWNSYYGFWDPNIGEPGTNHTPDTFPPCTRRRR